MDSGVRGVYPKGAWGCFAEVLEEEAGVGAEGGFG